MSIAHQNPYGIRFHTDTDTYEVIDPNNNVIKHPVKGGFNYVVNLKTSGFDQVDLTQADFGPATTHILKFDYLGSPLDGNGSSMAPDGVIKISGAGVTYTISVRQVTGYVSVQ